MRTKLFMNLFSLCLITMVLSVTARADEFQDRARLSQQVSAAKLAAAGAKNFVYTRQIINSTIRSRMAQFARETGLRIIPKSITCESPDPQSAPNRYYMYWGSYDNCAFSTSKDWLCKIEKGYAFFPEDYTDDNALHCDVHPVASGHYKVCNGYGYFQITCYNSNGEKIEKLMDGINF